MNTQLNALAIFGGTPAFAEKLHVGRPNIGDRARLLERVNQILDSRWLTNDGPCVKEFEERIVDAMAMNLVLAPEKFDMIVTTNLFGDILSDEISGLVGGLGLTPGANIGVNGAIFEAVHGTAPDIAGKGVANPGALILAACMMLEHIGDLDRSSRVRRALETTITGGKALTRDLGGKASTEEFTNAVIAAL